METALVNGTDYLMSIITDNTEVKKEKVDHKEVFEARQNIKNSLMITRKKCCKAQQAEIDFILRHM